MIKKPQDKLTNRLRKTVKKLLIDHGLEWSGEYLAKEIGCNRRSLSMALSGYRTGPGSQKILNKLSKRKRMGIKKINGKWSIPGGEVKAIVWMIQKYGENCIN